MTTRTTPRSTNSPAKPAAASDPCACPVQGRRAVGVDPGIKAAVSRRLARIEGQIRGLEKMVDEERYCADVLVQISSVQEALRGVSRQLLENHLKHCATDAIRRGPESAEAMYGELLDLVYKHAR
ncbi:metal-sensitive transcriptional regulator [Paracidobacterium acidisoli]|uniref:Metal-sensitive transcriptional regulator n=1 Tax=Paracidobacterium acidisoli TaxID=2303751 RepID=A0A372IUM9_9BACT|nr:metal-sensitive transcriptional regulator [Paracidobacterium acidisoli]MBT9329956.1 metal-sensitive transcriptional regulator [Paracidobacterium acidisoli]